MKEKLTKEDISILRYQLRAGMIISAMTLILGIVTSIFAATDISTVSGISRQIILSLFILVSILIAYGIYNLMNGKYHKDIRGGIKIIEEHKIEQKELKQDTEAGSGSLGQEMKTFNRYDIIIDHTRYRISKEFFEACTEGDAVLFHTVPISDFRLYIQLKQNKEIKFS